MEQHAGEVAYWRDPRDASVCWLGDLEPQPQWVRVIVDQQGREHVFDDRLTDLSRITDLWVAALARRIQDANGEGMAHEGVNPGRRAQVTERARLLLSRTSLTLELICDGAGVDPEALLSNVQIDDSNGWSITDVAPCGIRDAITVKQFCDQLGMTTKQFYRMDRRPPVRERARKRFILNRDAERWWHETQVLAA